MNPESVSSSSGSVKLRPARHRFMSIPFFVSDDALGECRSHVDFMQHVQCDGLEDPDTLKSLTLWVQRVFDYF